MGQQKAIVVSDWKYVRSRDTKRLANALKYYQYRDDRNWDKSSQFRDMRRDRWIDRGLGTNYGDIQQSCGALRGKHVEAWTWVINPDPVLMNLIPEKLQRDVLVELTDAAIEAYYEARGVPVPEYSFVIHDRLTKSGDEQQGLPDLHTHVVLPGTVLDPDNLHRRINFYNNVDRGHDVILRESTTQAFEEILDRTIGLECGTPRIEQPEIEPAPEESIPDSVALYDWSPNSALALSPLAVTASTSETEPAQEQFSELSLEEEIERDLDDPENWNAWLEIG